MPIAGGGGNLVTGANIVDASISNADIASNAAIAYSKLNLAASIVNGDLDPSVGKVVELTLSAAQIISMFATPIALVAGIAGKVIVIEEAVFNFIYGTVQFTSGGTVRIIEETSATALVVTGLTNTQMQAAANITKTWLAADGVVRTVGKGVMITNLTGAFATGDGTLKISLKYRTITAT